MNTYKAATSLKNDIDLFRTAILSCLGNSGKAMSEQEIWQNLPANIRDGFTNNSLSNMLALMLTEASIVKC